MCVHLCLLSSEKVNIFTSVPTGERTFVLDAEQSDKHAFLYYRYPLNVFFLIYKLFLSDGKIN